MDRRPAFASYGAASSPWSSDAVTNFYWNRMRTNLSLAQPTSNSTNGFTYNAAKSVTTAWNQKF